MPDSIVTACEESDVLDPRTDAVRPSVPPIIKPVDLGPVHVETPVVLSPMAGVTNWPFRVICESYGPDGLYVAEMITARALVARNPKALRLCHFAPSENIRSLELCDPQHLFAGEIEKLVRDCMAEMPELTRQVFTARRIHGKSYREIAAECGITERRVETELEKALGKLREVLRDYLPLVLAAGVLERILR